jgi:hypothetical protein
MIELMNSLWCFSVSSNPCLWVICITRLVGHQIHIEAMLEHQTAKCLEILSVAQMVVQESMWIS